MKRLSYIILLLGILWGCEKETVYKDAEEVEGEGVRVAVNDSVQNIDEGNSSDINVSEDHQTVTISESEEEVEENTILVLDLDTTGIIRRVTSANKEDNETVCQTEQANMEDIFGEASFKLSTSMIEPQTSLKNLKTNAEISEALTDDEGFIHPVEIIYHTRDGVVKKSSESDVKDGEFGDNLHIHQDFSGKKLYSNDLVDFYISEGYAEFTPKFKFEFDYEQPSIDWDNLSRQKGELKTFKFWSDETKLDFKTMVSCQAEEEIEIDKKKILFGDVIKTSFKFMVGPVPVYISIGCDIYGKYNLEFSTQLEATTGFQSTRYVTLGVAYENNSWNTFNDFRKEDEFFEPELSANANLSQRLELYPHFDVKFYSLLGPNLDVVPFVYNENTIDASGSWDAWLNLGVDARIGAEVEAIGESLASYQSDNINLYTDTVWEDSGKEDNLWHDDFETYSEGDFPSEWQNSGNSSIKATTEDAYSGSQAVSLKGSSGGCVEALLHREFDNSHSHYQIEFAYLYTGEGQIGCHDGHGGAGIRTAPDWTKPGVRGLVKFSTDMEILSSSKEKIGEYSADEWVKIKVDYIIEEDNVILKYYVDGEFVLEETHEINEKETDPRSDFYFTVKSNDIRCLYDDIRIVAYE